jgi:hypothetical protein
VSIKVGSFVNVYWENISCEMGLKVLSLPCAEGDCWTLQRPGGTEIKIIHFGKMEETVDPSIDGPF